MSVRRSHRGIASTTNPEASNPQTTRTSMKEWENDG